MLLADGLEEAIIGAAYLGGDSGYVAVYDKNKCVECLMKDGMEEGEAIEYLEFNTYCAYVGPKTPLFVDPMNYEQITEFANELSD